MKTLLIFAAFLLTTFLAGCSKSADSGITEEPKKAALASGFQEFFIPKGQHFSTHNPVTAVSYTELSFLAIFDSSCIYSNYKKENSSDINKLYGFSDCGTAHHVNSARFGWLWNGSAIEIYAYSYVNGIRQNKLIDLAQINETVRLDIKAEATSYTFLMKGKEVKLPRHCTGLSTGYRLYPYFGGDEVAPHDIKIRIQELN